MDVDLGLVPDLGQVEQAELICLLKLHEDNCSNNHASCSMFLSRKKFCCHHNLHFCPFLELIFFWGATSFGRKIWFWNKSYSSRCLGIDYLYNQSVALLTRLSEDFEYDK